MPYARHDYQTKKELKQAVAKQDVPVFQPGPFGPIVKDGHVALEGPHFPKPHVWYAEVEVRNGVIPRRSKVR